MKILLISGHGDGDPGAVYNGWQEQYLTREFSKLVKAELIKYNCICDVASPGINFYTYLQKHSYNFKAYDYVLEIHFNAGGGNGSEILIRPEEKPTRVEECILNNVCEYGDYKRRGVKNQKIYVLGKIRAQGVKCSLLEVCFIDSKADMMNYELKKVDIAQGVAVSFALQYGLKKKGEVLAMENKLKEIEERLEELESRLAVYNYIDKNMPDCYKPTIKKLVNNGWLKGDEDGLQLTDEMMRIFTILDRGGVFGK